VAKQLTEAEVEVRRKGGQARAAQLGSDGMAALGKLGFRAMAQKYGMEKAVERLRQWRLDRPPSAPERKLDRIVEGLGLSPGLREYQPIEGQPWSVDRAWPSGNAIIEVYGNVHSVFRTDKQRQHEAERIAHIEAAGWRVLIVTEDDLAGDDAILNDRVLRFLMGESDVLYPYPEDDDEPAF